MSDTITTHEELAAAKEEGLLPMPEDLVPLREEALALKEELDKLTARRNEIKEAFAKRLEQDAAQGYILNGKVHARVTFGTRHTVDSKELKAKMPHIWSQFLKVTKYRSITVN